MTNLPVACTLLLLLLPCRAEPEFGDRGTALITQNFPLVFANYEKSKTRPNVLLTGASSAEATGQLRKIVKLEGESFAGQNR